MASAVRTCRVCGKQYEACRSANRTAGVFRWQEVACSPECGSIYLQRINESRGIAEKKNKAKRATIKQAVVKATPEEMRRLEEALVQGE
nr:MAG TPA_asm: zinc-ribbon domain protein [Bacteriophage sp.]DAM79161.1 MAG TPA: zinc-ribbon domain protein [Caudoviricetes sp.]